MKLVDVEAVDKLLIDLAHPNQPTYDAAKAAR